MNVSPPESSMRPRSWRQIAGRVPAIDRALRGLRRTDEIIDLQHQVEILQRQFQDAAEGRSAAERQLDAERQVAAEKQLAAEQRLLVPDSVKPFLEWAPPGHFYSALPDLNQVERDAKRIFALPDQLPGIEVHEQEQLALFDELAQLARDAPLPAAAGGFFAENGSYGVGDAMILQSMLRKIRPTRYIEVGSGWTTALAVDTNQAWLDGSMRITAIEPYAELVRSILPENSIEVLAQPVQDVSLDLFSELERGDVLFIDCSHVIKAGSDAHHLVTRVLPLLASGVHVHLHDMFWPFEYPRPWIEEGRAWSELYLLHAFLLFNPAFSIEMFNDWLARFHHDEIGRKLPAMLENTGGALWLRVEDRTGG